MPNVCARCLYPFDEASGAGMPAFPACSWERGRFDRIEQAMLGLGRRRGVAVGRRLWRLLRQETEYTQMNSMETTVVRLTAGMMSQQRDAVFVGRGASGRLQGDD